MCGIPHYAATSPRSPSLASAGTSPPTSDSADSSHLSIGALLQDLSTLMPRCAHCEAPFDAQTRLPFLLMPCAHTVCALCLVRSGGERKKRRRCAHCRTKCTARSLNTVVLNLVIQTQTLARSTVTCSECLQLLPARLMRRCRSCELEVLRRTTIARVHCVICVECVIEKHRDHHVEWYARSPTPSTRSARSARSKTPSRRSRASPPPAAPMNVLQKVLSVPYRLATSLLRHIIVENSPIWNFLEDTPATKKSSRNAMNPRQFATLFDTTPKNHRQRENNENFWWSLGQEAARTPPFLLSCVSSADGSNSRKLRRETSRHARPLKEHKAPTATSFQLLAGDLLLDPLRRERDADERSSRQLFYSSNDFINYVNLLRGGSDGTAAAGAATEGANNFDNFTSAFSTAVYDGAGLATARSRKRSIAAAPRKISAPPPLRCARHPAPISYSKIV